MAKDIKSALKKAQGVWEDSEAAENAGRKKTKPGEYQCKIKSMEVEFAKSSKRLQVKTIFEVVSPEKYEGEEIWRFDGLTESGTPYFKAMARTLGLEVPEDLESLPDALEEFTDDFDSLVEVSVSTKDDFTNVFVNGLVDGESDDDDDDDDKKKKKKKDDDDNDDDNDDDDDDDDKKKKKKDKKKKKR